jgi:ribonuclease R
VFHQRRGYGSLVCQEPPLQAEVFVPESGRGRAEHGDVVLVQIREWGETEVRPVGEVAEVLGRPGDPGLDVLTILLGHGLPLEFPDAVEREAGRVARRGLRPEDVLDREDFRDVSCFTIDPADARDHDDAISVLRRDGGLEVGVHIADVAWYVKEGGAIDCEALERGTSVYLVDRVVPMLPEPLSAGLCSLLPGEDRLTVSVVFRFDDQGRQIDRRVVRGVVRSQLRLSYERAQTLLGARSGLDEPEGEIAEALQTIVPICQGLREARATAGAIDFAVPEAEVRLDARGEPLEIRPRQRLEAHRIVEDLMILANETIARIGIEQGLPLIYRVHEEPDVDRIQNLRDLAGFFGYRLPARNVRPRDLARMLDAMRDQPHENLMSSVTLRSMRQARYTAVNVGHFGLASTAYLHFTSPIRRYPDLTVHRQVVRWLGGRSGRGKGTRLEAIARHASRRERRAQEAERESVDAKKILYMRRHVGDWLEGTISGVTGFGLFVSLNGVLVEGLVRLGSLVDDFYLFDAEGHAVVGRRTGRRYRLGDRIMVRVVRVDTETREVDLEPVEGSA